MVEIQLQRRRLSTFWIKNLYKNISKILDFPDSPMNFGATSIIVSGLLRIQKADVDLLGPFAKKIFDFWWSGTLLPPCFVDQKVG